MLSPEEVESLADLSLRHHRILLELVRQVLPGRCGLDLAIALGDRLAGSAVKAACFDISRNDEVCHIPPDDRPFAEGDILTLDLVLEERGLFADGAWSLICGEDLMGRRPLLEAAWACARDAVCAAAAGRSSLILKKKLHNRLAGSGFRLLEESCGHGIGRRIHEEPDIRYDILNPDDIIWRPGMVVTAEPVLSGGGSSMICRGEDRWFTAGGDAAAYFEHMVYIGEENTRCLNFPKIFSEESIDIF